MTKARWTLAVLGGSGLYDLPDLEDVRALEVDTPYGRPSGPIVEGTLAGEGEPVRLLFLPRHGPGHRLAPGEINYRANVCALKKAGATHLVSVSAVGSMREAIAPGDFVVVDQYIDLTKKRASTFFDEGIVAHVGFAEPVCPLLSAAAAEAAEETLLGEATATLSGGATAESRPARVHRRGTYVCMEGPQFSTRAESRLYRTWGVDVIGMTGMPEAKLAREAELPFACVAMATDYDCWHETEEAVTVEAVIATLSRNVEAARRMLRRLVRRLPDPQASPASTALRGAIITAPAAVSAAARDRLSWLLPDAKRA